MVDTNPHHQRAAERSRRTVTIAGAYLPSHYDIFRRFVMRRILARKDPEADPDADLEYTDWPALDALVDDWIAAT